MNADHALTPYAEIASILENLPLILREARRARGVSLRTAAQQIGCNYSTLTRIEKGSAYYSDAAVLILRWLDHPMTEQGQP